MDESQPTAEELATLAGITQDLPVQRWTLDNGLTVLSLTQSHAVVTDAFLVFPGGDLATTAPGLNAMTRQLMASIYGDIGEFSMRRIPWHIGGSWTTWRDADLLAMGVLGSPADLKLLPFLPRKRVEQAMIQRKGRHSYLHSVRRALKQAQHEPSATAWRLRMDPLVGTHPGRLGLTQERLKDQARVSVRQAREWLQTQVQPANATLVVTGPQDVVQLREATRRWLVHGHLRLSPVRSSPSPGPFRHRRSES